MLRYRITEASLQSQYSQLLASLTRSVGQLEPINTFAIEGQSQPEFEEVAEPADTANDERESDSLNVDIDEDEAN